MSKSMKAYLKPETAVADFVVAKTILMASGVTPGSIKTQEYHEGSIKII